MNIKEKYVYPRCGFGSVLLFYIITLKMKSFSELMPYLYCRHRYRPQAQAVGPETVAAVVVSAGTHGAYTMTFGGKFCT